MKSLFGSPGMEFGKEPAHVCSWAVKKYIVKDDNNTDNALSSAWNPGLNWAVELY